MGQRMKGWVKWFNEIKGFGFIMPADGSTDVFFFFTSVRSEGYLTIRPGQAVEFDVVDGVKGPRAINIDLIDGSFTATA